MIELHRAPGFDRVLELYPPEFLREPVERRLTIIIDSLKIAIFYINNYEKQYLVFFFTKFLSKI